MKLIGNFDNLKADTFAYSVYDKLNAILEGDNSFLYYMLSLIHI